jgi:hypothetical protein
MSTDEHKIITPQEFMTRQNVRAALVDINKRLVRELDVTRRAVAERDVALQAMNRVFTKIAQIVGTPVPETAEAGINCINTLIDRVQELVEKEKKHEQS